MNILDLNTFPVFSQAFIEKTYLRSLSGSEKNKSKDGFIEREVHGAMHGGRVSIYIDIFDQIVSSYFPEYVQDSLNGLAQELGYIF